jgi:uncharacterized membrane protein YpjA
MKNPVSVTKFDIENDLILFLDLKQHIMTKKLIIKNITLGILSWLIPFVVSFFLVKPGGEYIVPYATFKCIIMVIGTISGCYLLYRYFKVVDNCYLQNGVLVGVSWFFMNIILDTVVLIPMMKTSFTNYFMTIGLGYFAIPAISIAMGYSLEVKLKDTNSKVV